VHESLLHFGIFQFVKDNVLIFLGVLGGLDGTVYGVYVQRGEYMLVNARRVGVNAGTRT
jgi:hypothetical protein